MRREPPPCGPRLWGHERLSRAVGCTDLPWFCKRLHHITHRQEHLGDSGLQTHHAASVPRVGELLFHTVPQLNPPQERHLGQSCAHQPQLSLQLPAPSRVVCHNTLSLEP